MATIQPDTAIIRSLNDEGNWEKKRIKQSDYDDIKGMVYNSGDVLMIFHRDGKNRWTEFISEDKVEKVLNDRESLDEETAELADKLEQQYEDQ